MRMPFEKSYIQPFYAALKKLGFKREVTASRDGRMSMMQYGRGSEDHFKLEVQFWLDGKHRVSHWHHGSDQTRPTNFTTVSGMVAAIDHETHRCRLQVPKDDEATF